MASSSSPRRCASRLAPSWSRSPRSSTPMPETRAPGGRHVCIHGHFYQPPRENPWIEEVEVQDSAAPFHDWNERIAAECYGPNGAARLKNPQWRISDIVNNYVHLSFNFG